MKGLKPKLISGLILLALVLLFAVQNSVVVTIKFLLWSFSASQALIIFLTGVAGVLIGWFIGTAFKITRQ